MFPAIAAAGARIASAAASIGRAGKGSGPGNIASGVKLKDQLGVVEDKITVLVEGGPRSNLKQLFRLAAAVAFGKVKRLVPAGGRFNPLPPPGAIGVKYNIERRAILFTLHFSRNIATITTVGDGVDALAALPAMAGPTNECVGGDFDFKPAAVGLGVGLGGLLAPAVVAMPALEFAGKTILTTAASSPDPNPAVVGAGAEGPTKNPRPQGDARTRGSLIRMVSAALAAPAEQGPSTFNLPTDLNRFTGG